MILVRGGSDSQGLRPTARKAFGELIRPVALRPAPTCPRGVDSRRLRLTAGKAFREFELGSSNWGLDWRHRAKIGLEGREGRSLLLDRANRQRK